MQIDYEELKYFLEKKTEQYNTSDFIETDPIQIPHSFSEKENIEIAAFLSSMIAWGNRKMIIKNAKQLIKILDNNPHDFIKNCKRKDIEQLPEFKHRTINSSDLHFVLMSLKNIYRNHCGLQTIFEKSYLKNESIIEALATFRDVFFDINYPCRTQKHISNVRKNSAAKRLNMFLMWMVRKDNSGVHFGIWDKIKTKDLLLPLDIHTGNVGRKLGLLSRKQNDLKAVQEITSNLRKFDSDDPVKYDFALFGLGVFEKFK